MEGLVMSEPMTLPDALFEAEVAIRLRIEVLEERDARCEVTDRDHWQRDLGRLKLALTVIRNHHVALPSHD
jgi:hypothetical protein